MSLALTMPNQKALISSPGALNWFGLNENLTTVSDYQILLVFQTQEGLLKMALDFKTASQSL